MYVSKIPHGLIHAYVPSRLQAGSYGPIITDYHQTAVWNMVGDGRAAVSPGEYPLPMASDEDATSTRYWLEGLSNSLLLIPDSENFGSLEGTINCWHYGAAQDGQFLWGRNAGGNNAGDFYVWRNASKWAFVIQDGTSTDQILADSNTVNAWQMVTATWREGEEMALWLDGVKQSSVGTTVTSVDPHATGVQMAWRSSGSSYVSSETLSVSADDDFCIWNRQLSDEEIWLLAQWGRSGAWTYAKHNVAVQISFVPQRTQYLRANMVGTGDLVPSVDFTGPLDFATDIVGSGDLPNIDLGVTKSRTVSSTLAVTDEAERFSQQAGDSILFGQSAEVEIVSNLSASDLFEPTDELATNRTISPLVLEQPNIIQQVTVAKLLPLQSPSHTLNLVQEAFGSHASENVLELTQEATGEIFFLPGDGESTLALTQTTVLDLTKEAAVTDSLGFSQTVISGAAFSLSTSTDLALTSAALGIVLDDDCYVVLQAPFTGAATSIILPCPRWNDTEGLASTMSLRRSMNNRVQTYVKSNNRRRVNYTFRILNRRQAIELVDFIKSHNSDEMRLLNWKGELWKVYAVNNPFDFIQNGRAAPGGDLTDISIEFEGVLLNG